MYFTNTQKENPVIIGNATEVGWLDSTIYVASTMERVP
jgi:hypothetical protein